MRACWARSSDHDGGAQDAQNGGANREGDAVKCALCKLGEAHPGTTTVTLQRGETMVIIKAVPADVCENCGEYYLSDAITEKVLAMAEDAVSKGAEVEIIRFIAPPALSASST